MNSITFEELRAKLVEYDKEQGSYPEHEYEGKSVFEYLTNTDIDIDDWLTLEKKLWVKE